MPLTPKQKNTAFGVGGGIFTSLYSNGLRHLPLLDRFPRFHLTAVAVGGTMGYLVGVYEEGAMRRHELFLQRYRAERAPFES
ncbi:hypothetical protein SARC_10000 [Sphaeroforma arctica JP610]|uniref:Uncharacterized protein n=1 Tax=Sphaeroforma arctica JP610 TaxID=667725 RepID=A0A0L0FL84_9EUKA|nr:hypothetical protein SARC_10000 [Sphaeroforma arctica JP610]KNC77539.1 hypothetical protein SARC_10000 [Sphaeroforma arctica JP610]|eukprot:XP_014151441.1 hypothetical protein SARC_10000 [Sphaeroforma arctica JP610]